MASKSLDLRIGGWLQYELQQQRVTGLDGEFVPRDVLNQRVTYDVIRKVLEETEIYTHLESALVLGILKERQRCFAILVDIGINDYIWALLQSSMKDCHLPISAELFLEKFKSTMSPAVQSGSKKPSTSRPGGPMETDRLEKLADMFCLRQREYLAPILQHGQHYDSEDGVMPFLPVGNTFYNYDDGSLFVHVHPAHHDFPPACRDAENVDGPYQVALRPCHMDEPQPFLLYHGHGHPSDVQGHLLQAVASHRPREQGRRPQPIRLIFPILGPTLADVWRQSLVTDSSFLRFCLNQMTGIAEALAFVVQLDPGERYISLRQITPRSIQWCKRSLSTFQSGTLRLDLRTLIADQSKGPVRQFEEAYRAPYGTDGGD